MSEQIGIEQSAARAGAMVGGAVAGGEGARSPERLEAQGEQREDERCDRGDRRPRENGSSPTADPTRRPEIRYATRASHPQRRSSTRSRRSASAGVGHRGRGQRGRQTSAGGRSRTTRGWAAAARPARSSPRAEVVGRAPDDYSSACGARPGAAPTQLRPPWLAGASPGPAAQPDTERAPSVTTWPGALRCLRPAPTPRATARRSGCYLSS